MSLEQLLPWLTGPVAALVLSLALNWFQKKELDRLHDDIRSGRLLPREFYDKALTTMDKAVDAADTTARGIEERNRLESERLRLRREEASEEPSLSRDLADTERSIRTRRAGR